MKQPVSKNADRRKAAAARNAADRKKLIVALLLLGIMALLWIRFFARKSSPASASAGLVAEASYTQQPQSGGITYIELPYVPERHNAITGDLFSAANFKRFKKQGQQNDEQLNITSTTGKPNSGAAAAAAALQLIAIVNDKKPQAFIESRLFEKGQSFRYRFGGQIYSFKIINILEDRIELECNGTIISKKISRTY